MLPAAISPCCYKDRQAIIVIVVHKYSSTETWMDNTGTTPNKNSRREASGILQNNHISSVGLTTGTMMNKRGAVHIKFSVRSCPNAVCLLVQQNEVCDAVKVKKKRKQNIPLNLTNKSGVGSNEEKQQIR